MTLDILIVLFPEDVNIHHMHSIMNLESILENVGIVRTAVVHLMQSTKEENNLSEFQINLIKQFSFGLIRHRFLPFNTCGKDLLVGNSFLFQKHFW